ncbi:MAG: GNAT family N-acetyltransferase [Methylotenera sp.]|nr:GNAT family N-acetyltransferase [Oligoflexia bacterium]
MTLSSPLLRPALNSEIPEIVEMIGEYHALDHLAFDSELTLRLLAQLVNDSALGKLFAIVAPGSGGELSGYLILAHSFSIEYRGKDAFIDEFYLREKYRGQGLGHQVLKEVQAHARSDGIEVLHLEVERKNARAMGLYRKVGFRDQDRYLLTFGMS